MKFFVFILGVSSLFATCQKKVAIAYLDASKSKNYKIISWRQISGTKSTIEDKSNIITRVFFNTKSVNYIELTVKDSLGRTDKDTIKVTVIK